MPPSREFRRILVVDDEANVLLGLRRLLERHGLVVAGVPNARRALEFLAMAPADALIADYKMETHDGVWLMQEVAREHPDVHRILISGYTIPDVERLQEDGVIHHWAQKPIEMRELLTYLGVRKELQDPRQADG